MVLQVNGLSPVINTGNFRRVTYCHKVDSIGSRVIRQYRDPAGCFESDSRRCLRSLQS